MSQGEVQAVVYDQRSNTLVIDGVRIAPELIRAVFAAPGRRRHVVFEPDGRVRYLSSEPVDDTVVYTEHEAPTAPWW